MRDHNGKKHNIRYAIVSLLTCLGFAALCAGCDRSPERREESAIETLPDKEGSVLLPEELRPCIVQIYCGDYRGSGVIWEVTEEEVTVASCRHLLENGDTCEILCYAGVYYEAKVDRLLEESDIGFAVFAADALGEDGVELKAVIPSAREKEKFVAGEELVIYGSMDSVAENFVEGYLIEAESAIQPEGYDSEQPLMLGGIVRGEPAPEKGSGLGGIVRGEPALEGGNDLQQGAVDAGMSGSGVFDKSGKLVGILAGGDGEDCFMAVPVWRIREEAGGKSR